VEPLLTDIEGTDAGMEFLSILTAIRHLPGRKEHTPELRKERNREEGSHQAPSGASDVGVSGGPRAHRARRHDDERRAARSKKFRSAGCAAVRAAVPAGLLGVWAAEEINYRRFFDINELAALRMEDPDVFEQTHAFVFDLLREGCIDGIRN
jgi:(1->4)-alpha-D-glucan 1-alpha-D-glucosylmutase